jgi:hypothetical protein
MPRAETAVTTPPSVTPDLVPANAYAAAIKTKLNPNAEPATLGPSQRLETRQICDTGTSMAL